MSPLRWCTVLLILWTIASGPGLEALGSGSGLDRGRGEQEVNLNKNVSRNARDSGLRKSGDIVTVRSSLGGEETFSRVRRIRRETSTGFLKVHLSGGSYVYRPVASVKAEVAQNVSRELTRIARAFADDKKGGGYSGGSKPKGGYSGSGGYPDSKRKGYGYAKPTPPAPEARITTEENDSQGFFPELPRGQSPSASARTTTTTTTTEDPVDVRDNIPGEPGKDYKALSSIPKTTFSCEGRAPGFYADVEAGCQVFHRCTDDPWYTGQVRVIMDSFLCPNGSLFNQQIFACDWWGNTDCKSSEEFFELNQQIGQLEETDAGTVQYVKFTGIRVPTAPGTKKVAPGIVPKKERQPLPAEYKTRKEDKTTLKQNSNGRPLESDSIDDDLETREFLSSQDDDFRPLSAEIESTEPENIGSSQTVDEVKVKKSKKKSRKAKQITTTTTTTPPPNTSSEEEESSEETQEPSAATNSQSRPLVVNRGRDEKTESQTPAENLLPPEFDGEPVPRDGDNRDRDGDRDRPETTTPSSRNQNATPRQDYLPPRDEYLPPKDTGYKYSKPENPLKLPGGGKDYLPPNQKPDNEYLPPRGGEYLSGTSPSSNQYLPPTTQGPGGEYLPPRNTYSSPGGLHTYNPNADSYFRKSSSGYGTPQDSYLPPNPPSREYGQPNNGNNNNYLPPSREYGGPNKPNPEYGHPNKDYLPPHNREYGQPNNGPPSREYGQPNNGPPSREYGQPNNGPPSREYGQPNNGPPSREYGQPNNGPPSREYGQPNNDYLPPNRGYPSSNQPPSREYGLPNNPPPSREYGQPNNGPPSREYGGPNKPNPEYGQPNKDYLPPPNREYGQPNNGPPSREYGQPNNPPPPPREYGQPNNPPPPSRDYGQPNNNYLHPGGNANKDGYQTPKPEYLPPIQPPLYNYGTPQTGSGYTFFPHQTTITSVTEHWPASASKFQFDGANLFDMFQHTFDTSGPGFVYGSPPTPGTHYDATTRNPYSGNQGQSNAYLPPRDSFAPPPSSGYESQQQRPPDTYLPPNQNQQRPPGDSYLPPRAPSGDYGLPQGGGGGNSGQQRPSDAYLPPNQGRPEDSYLPPRNDPSGNYGPPQKPSGDYGTPQRPSGDYGPPKKPSGDYGTPQRPPPPPSGDYGLPQRPSGDYGKPQRPSGDYGPPQRPSGDYGPPSSQKPNDSYLPPKKPGNEYLPPQSPSSSYLPPPKPDNSGYPPGYTQISQPPTQEYGAPTTGGYSTLPDHILKDYNPSAHTPTPQSYSTIPEQTPPPIYDSGQHQQTTGPGAGLYTIQAPKIDIVSVPLVSYHSHVVTNPIIEFPPFKKKR